MPRVRGRIITPGRAYVKEKFGENGWQRVLDRMAPADRQIVDGLIPSESWYEVDLYNRFFDAILAEFAGEQDNLAFHIGRCAAEMNVPLFHRMLMRFGSPNGMFHRAAALWKEYFDDGRMEVIERGDNHTRVMLYDDNVRPWFPREMLPGWSSKVIEMTGHEVVTVRLAATHEGTPPSYELVAEWR
jgi:hypothetical protein